MRDPISASAAPSTTWKEFIEPDEQALFDSFAREIAAQQNEVAQTSGKLLRGFHAKLHAGLMAEFQVLPNLPEYTRFVVFSEARVFPAAELSRGSGGEQSQPLSSFPARLCDRPLSASRQSIITVW